MAKTIRLTTSEALDRLEKMHAQIEIQVRMTIRIEQALEVANTIVSTEVAEKDGLAGSDCYNMIHFSLSIRLALELCKLFEFPMPGSKETQASRSNRSDIASIPLMMRLLSQKRCRTALCKRARSWQPEYPSRSSRYEADCNYALDSAEAAFARCKRGGDRSVNLSHLKHFRDKYIAHLYYEDKLKHIPRYVDLFNLVDVARDVTMHTRLALTGVNIDLQEYEAIMARDARRFWGPALAAAREAPDKHD